MFKINTGDTEYQVEIAGDQFIINGEKVNPRFIKIDDGIYRVLVNEMSFNMSVLKAANKQFSLKINGKTIDTNLSDPDDILLEKLGMDQLAGVGFEDIMAPMPGLVLDVNVSDGQEVKAGEALLVLEAMKMENVIKATTDAVINQVAVKSGEAVEKNQVLITFQ